MMPKFCTHKMQYKEKLYIIYLETSKLQRNPQTVSLLTLKTAFGEPQGTPTNQHIMDKMENKHFNL